MESRRKRSRSQMLKWGCYILLLVVCTVVQTTPGLFQFGAAKPLWLLPLGLAVSALEGEFAGAIFGAVCGLMWDYTAGRTVGMLALEMMILCFGVSVIVQLYLKDTPSNFVLLAVGGALLVLAADWLFFYYMPGYSWALSRWATQGQRSASSGPCCRRPCSQPRGAGCSTAPSNASARNSRSITAWCDARLRRKENG